MFMCMYTCILTDCMEDIDEVWGLQWPYAPGGEIVTISCGVDFIGILTITLYTV